MADSLKNRLEAFLDAWGDKVAQSANDVADATVKYSGGQSTGLEPNVVVAAFEDGSARFSLTMKPHWKFIEYGVDGLEKSHGSKFKFKTKSPIPQKEVLRFIEARSITLESLKKYSRTNFKGISLKGRKKVRKSLKDLTFAEERKTLTFILGRSIKKHGIEPRPFVSKIITPELQTELKEGLAKIIGEQFIIDLKTL